MVARPAIQVLGVALFIFASACTPLLRQESSPFVAARSLDELVERSDVVLVGTVEREAGTRNLARDPKDLTREDPTYRVLGQDYLVAVQSRVKGNPPIQVTITVARSRGTQATGIRDDPDFIPLRSGQLYVLFLRRLPYEPSVLALAIEPSRFRVEDKVVVESPWTEAQTYFPAEGRDTFLSRLRSVSK